MLVSGIIYYHINQLINKWYNNGYQSAVFGDKIQQIFKNETLLFLYFLTSRDKRINAHDRYIKYQLTNIEIRVHSMVLLFILMQL